MGVLGGADRSDISFDRLLSGVTIKSVSPYWSISGNATGSEFGFGQWQHRDLTATRCEQACLASARCTSFSMTTAGGIPSCVFCSACELRKDPGWQSWLRSEGDGRLRRAQPVTHRTLQPLLQSAYSQALYGAHDLVPMDSLRVVWLEMLPRKALRTIAEGVGVCKWESKPPLLPFYAMNDMRVNPRGAMWVHRPASEVRPASDHEWVEIVHCKNPFIEAYRPLRPSRLVQAPWKLAPAWFWVAPGSGVAVNVGRSLVVPSWSVALKLLHDTFGGMSATDLGVLCDSAAPSLPPPKGKLRGYDSIQILSHQEYFSREPRHELILLKRRECEGLTADAKRSSSSSNKDDNGLRCGRPPHHLYACTDGHPGLRGMQTCHSFAQHEFGPPHSPVRRAMGSSLSRFKRGSPCSRSGCYSTTANGTLEYWCA
jgi:hypothetical protein